MGLFHKKNRQVGNKGEDIACEFLKDLGFKILDRNYQIRGGEIDVIAREKDTLVFIEVKTRYNYNYGLPVESITYWKIKAMLKSALFYIQKIKWGDKPYRLDLVTVDFAQSDKPKLEHIKNITG